MILNDENEAQTRHVVGQAMQNYALLGGAEEQLAFHKREFEKAEAAVRFFKRLRDELNGQIKALGYHDIGHARTELQAKGKP